MTPRAVIYLVLVKSRTQEIKLLNSGTSSTKDEWHFPYPHILIQARSWACSCSSLQRKEVKLRKGLMGQKIFNPVLATAIFFQPISSLPPIQVVLIHLCAWNLMCSNKRRSFPSLPCSLCVVMKPLCAQALQTKSEVSHLQVSQQRTRSMVSNFWFVSWSTGVAGLGLPKVGFWIMPPNPIIGHRGGGEVQLLPPSFSHQQQGIG